MTTKYLTTSRFIKGKFLSLIENIIHVNKKSVDSKHPGYTFIRHTNAINFRSASSVGIYANSSGKKFFIKDYAYTLKNLDFEYLHNEINSLQILNSKSLPHSRVCVPKIIHAEDNNKRISLITEYVDGKTLDNSSNVIMQETLIDVIKYLHNQSLAISESSLETIPKRLQILTFILFPIYLVRAFLKEPARSMFLLRGCIIFFRYLPHCIFQSVPYGISHRDLSVDNILYDKRKKQSVILDTECMVKTDLLYDVSLLPRLYIRYLNANQLLFIFHSLNLGRSDMQRLIILMITSTVSKIATEQKNARDYTNAVNGLKLILDTLIPDIEKEL